MLKKIRISLATLMLLGVTLLLLDFTGALHAYLGWMAKIQFWPSLIGLSIVPLLMVIALTLLLGRIYCSIICPLGVLQDLFMKLGRIGKRNPYSHSPAKTWLRWTMVAVMAVLFPLGMTGLLDPYSMFGRIANTLIRPIWTSGNNVLADIVAHYDSYSFYQADVLATGGTTLAVAAVSLIVVALLAAKNGRTYCNTICPVGTILSLFARHSYIKIRIDENLCRGCGKCAKNCKSACIDPKKHEVDYSRCVVCGDCLEMCSFNAISYTHKKLTDSAETLAAETEKAQRQAEPSSALKVQTEPNAPKNQAAEEDKASQPQDPSRRGALLSIALATTAAALAQDSKKVDGGLAAIEDKVAPERKMRILPPGAKSEKHFHHHCTACQLCVSACPNKVLRPATDLDHFMQPYASYESGYCRPECHACSDVCPARALHKLAPEQKASTQIGRAIFLKKNCLALEGKAECGVCERHCPTGAILMVPSNPEDEQSAKMPAVDETRCIGCGACENLCPARPFSAIYVEGIENQKEI